MFKGIKFPKFYRDAQVKKLKAQIALKKQAIKDIQDKYKGSDLLKDRNKKNEPPQM